MSRSQDPMDPTALLEKKIEEAELDLTDVQVNAVIMALWDVLTRHFGMLDELFKRLRRVQRGTLSINSLDKWVEEQDSPGGPTEHFKQLLLKADVELEDEAVVSALAVAKDVFIYADKCIDSVFEKLEQQ
jgi:hypothetical protein